MGYTPKQYLGLFLLAFAAISNNFLFTVDGSSYGTLVKGLVPVAPVLLSSIAAMIFAAEEVKDW